MKPLLATLLLMLVALAGCSEAPASDEGPDEAPKPDDELPAQEEEQDDEESQPASGGRNATSNSPPDVSFTADAVNGTVPLVVNLTVDATDADGDPLTWALDADGDGEDDADGASFPATHMQSYPADGNYTATVRVDDGTDETTRSITIHVVAGAVVAVTEIWELSWPDDGAGGCADRYMSLHQPSDFACTYTAQAAAAVEAPVWDFAADAPSSGHAVGTAVQAAIHPFFLGPYAGTLNGQLEADGVVVASGSADVGPSAGIGTIDLALDMTTTEAIPAGAMLTFKFTMETGGYMEMSSGTVTIG